jgi:hypothetical protein
LPPFHQSAFGLARFRTLARFSLAAQKELLGLLVSSSVSFGELSFVGIAERAIVLDADEVKPLGHKLNVT